MEDRLYKIAAENLKNKKRIGIVSFVGVSLFLIFFSYWLSASTTIIWPWFFMVPILVLTFYLNYYFGSKIIGEKDPVVDEMERLKALGIDEEEIENFELKEIIPRYDEDDLV